ncbi:type VI secretion system tip protein VgrG [Burkholderia multivorans]|uniref:type VI secretion system Vgr family protein n=1 Tax=Burkholderia multivorans TaxID=87883 RepID=UPI000CFF941C|nr:type VI secretion system tip protein TssI/VgrG [Burkholderia multivorans]MBU9278537.1 type VI secretion system tip protein VgrG [Burkholderia multivorans]MCA8259766.1 type VI secretion system tip protein VgrG [Burkholderia multivorans]MCO1362625.1 type VI secretion system tip protein VgrG [Burkholderia multivorans]MCO1422465.1 type VI secretion system tip protein VgrG [Burkholderia multivorans]MDN7399114.1 type VI secretion system tip protein TssI/VgrG [Burkholderia multivorans]
MSFAPNGGIPSGFGGNSLGSLSALGGLAGPIASTVAGQIGPLAGVAGHLDTVQRAVQLAQTGFSLMNKTPAAIADALNNATGGVARLTQLNRYVTIESPLGPDVLLVGAAVIDEHVNRLPEIHLDLLSHKHDLTPDHLIGQPIKLRLDHDARQSTLERIVMSGGADNNRYFDGYVASFDRAGNPGRVTQYHMTVVPWFWFLTRSTDCRIFQNKTSREILGEIFQDHGFTDFEFDIRTAQKPIEYIVMYQESYYNFCARLMEQEGLIWTHRYEKDKHILVIGDTNFVFRPIEGLSTVPYADSEASEFNGIDQLHEGRRFGVGKVTFQDFNHQNPSSPLMLVQAEPQTLRHARLDATERFEHQSLYDHGDDGNRYARIAMQAEEAQAHRYTGSGYAWRMTTACSVTVANHPVMANNQEYAILHVRHEAVNDYTQHAAKMPYRNSFALLPQNIPYRAPRNTPKPVIHGTQSAIVVGPKGEQIHTNGSCVKLHFLWDRRGQMDGSDSMWIRVSQPWAGAGWGAAAIPRIGQEVLVSFNQGDPDNPVIVGRVFNGEQGNPYHGAAGQTMGIKSQTHKGQGSNELRFSDVNGAQEVFLHAQKDMKTVIKDSETHTVEAGARTVSLLKGSETKQIAQGGLMETIALTRDTTANVINTKAIASKAGPGMQSHQASDGMEFRVGESIVTMTPDGIKLAHGPSTILMNANGIYLDAPVIHLNQGSAQAPEQALALQWAEAQAMIAQGLASPDPATRAAAGKLANSLKAQQMAKLADHVYHPNDPPPTGWKMVTNDPEALKAFRLKPDNFHLNDSNFGAQMYTPDPKVFGDSMKPTIAFKGTQSLSPVGDDMTNNIAQGLGGESPYYRKAVTIGNRLEQAGISSNVDFTGHSLGGGMASAAAEASGSSAVTFNAAGLNPETVAQYGGTVQATNITAYRVDGDILTGLQEGRLGPISDGTAQLMPKAIGTPVTLDGQSITTVGRHMMGDVTSGMNQQVAKDEFDLVSQLNSSH